MTWPLGDIMMQIGWRLQTRKSIKNYIFLQNNGAISWSSCKQPIIILSAMEVKYMATLQASTTTIWFCNYLGELGFKQKEYTHIFRQPRVFVTYTKSNSSFQD
jgi:hypothetical protein